MSGDPRYMDLCALGQALEMTEAGRRTLAGVLTLCEPADKRRGRWVTEATRDEIAEAGQVSGAQVRRGIVEACNQGVIWRERRAGNVWATFTSSAVRMFLSGWQRLTVERIDPAGLYLAGRNSAPPTPTGGACGGAAVTHAATQRRCSGDACGDSAAVHAPPQPETTSHIAQASAPAHARLCDEPSQGHVSVNQIKGKQQPQGQPDLYMETRERVCQENSSDAAAAGSRSAGEHLAAAAALDVARVEDAIRLELAGGGLHLPAPWMSALAKAARATDETGAPLYTTADALEATTETADAGVTRPKYWRLCLETARQRRLGLGGHKPGNAPDNSPTALDAPADPVAAMLRARKGQN